MTKAKKNKLPASPKPEMSEHEQEQLARQTASNRARPERPLAKVVVENGERIIRAADEQDDRLHGAALMEALGTRSLPFLNDTVQNVSRVLARGGTPTEQQHNAAMAILAAVEPENELEATLASQMVAANDCAMRCMRGMIGSDMTDQHKMFGDLANKFMRTFTAQIEALTKLRRGGEQVVKHVYVQEGGQAVIAGTLHAAGRGNFEHANQACGAEAAAGSAALPSPDASGDGVPVPGNAKRKVSHPRRTEHGSAEG